MTNTEETNWSHYDEMEKARKKGEAEKLLDNSNFVKEGD
jgi:hypothetical protein